MFPLCVVQPDTLGLCVRAGAVGDAGGPGAVDCFAAARAGLHSWG